MTVSSTQVHPVVPAGKPSGGIVILLRRSTAFVFGLALVCLAQYVFAQYTTFLHVPFTDTLQELIRVDVPNIENSVMGVLLLMVATGLLLYALVPYPMRQHAAAQPASRPVRPITFLRHNGLALLGGLVLIALLLYQTHLADDSSGLVLVWILGLALLVRVAYRFDRAAGTPLSPGLERLDVLWIVLLFAGGLAIGTYQLDRIPNSLVRDEGTFFERAMTIARGQEGRSFFDVGVYSYPMPGSFYQGGIVQIFGSTLWSWRFSSVLAGVLAVIPLYLLVCDMFDRRTALTAGVLMLTLPYFLAFERLGYNNIQAVLPDTLALYLLYLALRRGSAFYYALAGIAAGLGFYTYTASRLGLVVGVVYLGTLIAVKLLARVRRNPREEQRAVFHEARRLFAGSVVFVVLALATLLPNILYTETMSPSLLRYKTLESLLPNTNYALDFFPASELYRDYPPIQVGDQTFFYRPDIYVRLFFRGFARTLLSFQEGALVDAHYVHSPLAGPLAAIFFFVGLVISLRSIRERGFVLLFFWCAGGIVTLSMINTFPPRYQHMVPIIPVLAIFAALGVVATIRALAQILRLVAPDGSAKRISLLREPLTAVPAVTLVLLVTILLGSNLRTYFVDGPQHFLPGFEDIMAFYAIHLDKPTRIVYVYDDPNQVSWAPWMIIYVPTQADYRTVSADSLKAGAPQFQGGAPMTIFFNAPDEELMKSALRRALGPNDIEPVVYRDDRDRVLGMSYSLNGAQVPDPVGKPTPN